MKTIQLKPADVEQKWYIVDATDLVVGRLAAKLAVVLMGKNQPDYTPHVASGNNVVVINAEKIRYTGKKWSDKVYTKYTGYPNGIKRVTAEQLRDKSPETIIELAVKRMLPKNKLANKLLKQLKVYAGTEHPHQAQQPQPLSI